MWPFRFFGRLLSPMVDLDKINREIALGYQILMDHITIPQARGWENACCS